VVYCNERKSSLVVKFDKVYLHITMELFSSLQEMEALLQVRYQYKFIFIPFNARCCAQVMTSDAGHSKKGPNRVASWVSSLRRKRHDRSLVLLSAGRPQAQRYTKWVQRNWCLWTSMLVTHTLTDAKKCMYSHIQLINTPTRPLKPKKVQTVHVLTYIHSSTLVHMPTEAK
jgi:hypothetical protein